MKKDYKLMAKEILPLLNGKENVASFTNCMTRLRVTIKDESKVDLKGLEKLPYVIQVQVVAGVHQIVLGPGIVQKVAEEFGKLVGHDANEIDDNHQSEEKSLGKSTLKMIQAIVMPAIGGLMALALITAILNVLKLSGVDPTANIYTNSLLVFSTVGMASIGVLFIFNTVKYFKGNVYLGILFGLFLVSPSMSDITLFGQKLVPGIGGLIGMVLLGILIAYTERAVKKFIPDSLALLLVPLLTALITMVGLMFVIIPVASALTYVLIVVFTFIVQANPVIFFIGSVLIAASYPFLVLSGLHMSLFVVLMPIFTSTGFMPLIASAFLGGAAQLGTATAVYVKERKTNPKIKDIYLGGAPTAILGVVEPLMYGINLPRMRPLILASIAAGIGGGLIAIFNLTMGYALAGILGVLSFSTLHDMIAYGLIWIGTVVIGFVLCLFFYSSKEDKK